MGILFMRIFLHCLFITLMLLSAYGSAMIGRWGVMAGACAALLLYVWRIFSKVEENKVLAGGLINSLGVTAAFLGIMPPILGGLCAFFLVMDIRRLFRRAPRVS